jgi:preprotein translocase subunit YajC
MSPTLVTLLAQAAPQGAGPKGGPPGGILMLGMIIMVGVFFFVMMRGQSAQKKKKETMLDSLKKNDRVMTIGGVLGTVVTVRDNDVILKVDEASNTKMTFIKRAIQQVVTEDDDLTAANRQER